MKNIDSLNLVPPGKTIGILGGGQLGRMIALEGRRMGYRFVTLDPTEDSPCGQVADKQFIADYTNVEAARELAKSCDVVTYEFENVDATVAGILEEESRVPQGSHLLFVTQHRVREKSTLQKYGIPVPPFRPICTQADLLQGMVELGLPCVLKTSMGGYDGKNQWLFKSQTDVTAVWPEIEPLLDKDSSSTQATQVDPPLILEQFIPLQHELSVIVARNTAGEIKCFPPAENIHVEHILHTSIVPARIAPHILNEAEQIAKRIAEVLDMIGLVAVELFLAEGDKLYVNELAPRPHNSGHYTYDACVTSQFEQHIRAICNLPLGDTRLLSPVVMVNLLGQHLPQCLDKLTILPASAKLHLYGKKEIRPKRKMGHINFLASSTDEALRQINKLGIW